MTESTVAIDVDVLPKYRIGCVTQERIGGKEEFFRMSTRAKSGSSQDDYRVKETSNQSLFRIIAVPNLFGDNPQAILWSSVGCRVPSLRRHFSPLDSLSCWGREVLAQPSGAPPFAGLGVNIDKGVLPTTKTGDKLLLCV